MVDVHTLSRNHAGKRCFFLGTGPSLHCLDLSLLSAEIVWAANRAYLLFDRVSWRPSFYVIKDPRIVENSSDMIDLLMRRLPNTIFFFPDYIQDGRIASAPNACQYRELERTDNEYATFSFDVGQGVVRSHTVATVVLQLAVWMGFNPIILIGCDMSYQAEALRGQAEFSVTDGTDVDHFDSRYLDGGSWEVPDVEGMLSDLAMARQACDAHGVTILNATAGGNLEIFPRLSYTEFFRKR